MRVVLASVLTLATAATAAAAPVVVNPSWLKKPTSDDLHALWPSKALIAGRGGDARLECTVTTAGLLIDCKAIEEKPTGYGFGAAALALTPSLLFRPKTVDGEPVQAKVVIPISFSGISGGEGFAPGPSLIAPTWMRWLNTPSVDDLRSAVPPNAASLSGYADFRCQVRANGSLYACEEMTEEPRGRGFAQAARRVLPTFRADLTGFDPRKAGDLLVPVPIRFDPSGKSGPRFLTQVDWTRTLDLSQVQRLYPAAAAAANVATGKAVVSCQVSAAGALVGCVADTETPPGLGFGATGVALASVMTANLWTRDGQPAAGAYVRIPIRMNLAPSPPEAQAKAAKSSP